MVASSCSEAASSLVSKVWWLVVFDGIISSGQGRFFLVRKTCWVVRYPRRAAQTHVAELFALPFFDYFFIQGGNFQDSPNSMSHTLQVYLEN